MDNKVLVSEKDKKQYIVVTIGSEQYGFDIGYVDNIVRMQSITRVPKAQTYFKGIINLRGEIVAVMSIRLKMELEDDKFSDASRIIILKIEELGTIGIIVDEVKQIVELGSEDIDRLTKADKKDKNTFISGIGKYGDELISLFDIHAVVDESENI